MKTVTGYLGGAIAGTTTEEAADWRNYVKQKWGTPKGDLHTENGTTTLTIARPQFKFLDPMKRDFRDGYDDAKYRDLIVDLDLADITCSDFLLVNYLWPSVGTAMEVFFAYHNLGKLVLLVNSSKIPNHKLSPWIIKHSTSIFDDIDIAMDFAQKYFFTDFDIKQYLAINPGFGKQSIA